MTDTATEPGLRLNGSVNPPDKVRDPTAAERQRRYRQRKSVTDRHGDAERNEDRNGERNEHRYGRRDMLLCASQDEIEIAFDENGDAVITQKRWPDEDQTIIISRENLDTFIDRLTDALGIPSFGAP